jgi:anti-anti-sigma factor
VATTDSSFVTVSGRSLGSFAERDADCTVVWLRGEHDVSTMDTLSETMARAIALDDADVVVDLSEVRFMSAATVGVIIRAREFLRSESRSLALRSPSGCAGRVVELCGLGDLFDPRTADAMRLTRAASALSTWVAVPTAARVEQRTDDRATSAAGHRGP